MIKHSGLWRPSFAARLSGAALARRAALALLLITSGAALAPQIAGARGSGAAQTVDRTGQPWTEPEARAHAARFNDPALWNRKFLEQDCANDQANGAARASYPFSRMAFNAPDYELTERLMPGLMFSPIPLREPMAGSFVGVHQVLALSDVPAGEQWHDVVQTEPVLAIVATGPSAITNEGGMAMSRSHPHYFYEGAFTSTHGEIRWVAVHLADGTEIALIHGRVLDLSQGNLILVRQLEDGSIRIHQHPTRLMPARGADLVESIPGLLEQPELQRFLKAED